MQHELFKQAISLDPRSLPEGHRAAVEPLAVSPWVAMSCLQKAIRRNNVELALRSAATLLAKDPAKLWRRLAGIVFEDIGLGSIAVIANVMAGAAEMSSRDRASAAWALAVVLIETMCAAPKCRACDDLFVAVSTHHKLEELRIASAAFDLKQHLNHIRDDGSLLGASVAVLYASGVRWTGHGAGFRADPHAVFVAMRDKGLDPRLLALAERGFRKTREALPLLFPLLSLPFPSSAPTLADDTFPPVIIGCAGIPTYCFDAFSREGKTALARFLKGQSETARWLRRHVAPDRRLSVLAGGLFRIEGGLVKQRINWPCAVTLRWLADSGYHDMRLADPEALLAMIRADLPALDEERGNVC